jgi:hypothetical protein
MCRQVDETEDLGASRLIRSVLKDFHKQTLEVDGICASRASG